MLKLFLLALLPSLVGSSGSMGQRTYLATSFRGVNLVKRYFFLLVLYLGWMGGGR